MNNSKIAFVFPGQGSQSVGMLAEIAKQFSEVKRTFDEATDTLGYDLWQLVQHGPASELDKTSYTQPAVLTASYALWQILQHHSISPSLLAGHSLGEYTALVCAQSLTFEDALRLVEYRGQLMQAAVPEGVGAMAAIIGLSDNEVDQLCAATKESGEVLSAANYNSLGQVVIAGHRSAVERAMHLAKTKGAKLVTLIPVSVPSHCDLMQPAADRLALKLQDIAIKPPQIEVINNIAAVPYKSVDAIREGLQHQLTHPVRWVQTIQAVSRAGIKEIIECGPGKVLTGLNKRIDKTISSRSISDLANLNDFILSFQDPMRGANHV